MRFMLIMYKTACMQSIKHNLYLNKKEKDVSDTHKRSRERPKKHSLFVFQVKTVPSQLSISQKEENVTWRLFVWWFTKSHFVIISSCLEQVWRQRCIYLLLNFRQQAWHFEWLRLHSQNVWEQETRISANCDQKKVRK